VVVTTDALTSSIEELSDGAAILMLAGEIDLATAPQVISKFQELADRDLTDVIIDARDVSFIDSTGLHAFVKGKQIIHEKGSQIILVPSPQVRRLFDLVFPGRRLFADRMETMDEALAILRVKD
jgi:anti-sigma B factor antagonist